MAHWDQLGSLFSRADTGKARHFQRIPFRIIRQLPEHTALNFYEGMGNSRSFGLGFSRDVHHAGAAFFVVMREFGHFKSARISSPAAHSARSGSVTKKA